MQAVVHTRPAMCIGTLLLVGYLMQVNLAYAAADHRHPTATLDGFPPCKLYTLCLPVLQESLMRV